MVIESTGARESNEEAGIMSLVKVPYVRDGWLEGAYEGFFVNHVVRYQA
jgi:hypothetical protein